MSGKDINFYDKKNQKKRLLQKIYIYIPDRLH